MTEAQKQLSEIMDKLQDMEAYLKLRHVVDLADAIMEEKIKDGGTAAKVLIAIETFHQLVMNAALLSMNTKTGEPE